MKNLRCTQRDQVLNLLKSRAGQWIPLPEIAKCAAQYNARIYECRRLGFQIENRTQDVDGIRHSWFRLNPGPTQPAPTNPERPAVGHQTECLRLFTEENGGSYA